MKKIEESLIGSGYAIKPSFMSAGARFGVGKNGGGILGKIKPYDFSILPLNHSLEVRPSTELKTKNTSVGDFIQGRRFKEDNDNKIYNGVIKRIEKYPQNNEIKFYVISGFDGSNEIILDPNTIEDYKATHVQTQFRSQNVYDGLKDKAIKLGKV